MESSIWLSRALDQTRCCFSFIIRYSFVSQGVLKDQDKWIQSCIWIYLIEGLGGKGIPLIIPSFLSEVLEHNCTTRTTTVKNDSNPAYPYRMVSSGEIKGASLYPIYYEYLDSVVSHVDRMIRGINNKGNSTMIQVRGKIVMVPFDESHLFEIEKRGFTPILGPMSLERAIKINESNPNKSKLTAQESLDILSLKMESAEIKGEKLNNILSKEQEYMENKLQRQRESQKQGKGSLRALTWFKAKVLKIEDVTDSQSTA